MEVSVMILLKFKFYTVTPSSYIDVIVQVMGLDDLTATSALYMTSLAMMESDSVGVKPSLIAAAAGEKINHLSLFQAPSLRVSGFSHQCSPAHGYFNHSATEK